MPENIYWLQGIVCFLLMKNILQNKACSPGITASIGTRGSLAAQLWSLWPSNVSALGTSSDLWTTYLSLIPVAAVLIFYLLFSAFFPPDFYLCVVLLLIVHIIRNFLKSSGKTAHLGFSHFQLLLGNGQWLQHLLKWLFRLFSESWDKFSGHKGHEQEDTVVLGPLPPHITGPVFPESQDPWT